MAASSMPPVEINITFISTYTRNISTKNAESYDMVMKVIFSMIGIGSILPNALFLMAMLHSCSRIRGGYHNILLYNMMISDAFAGTAC